MANIKNFGIVGVGSNVQFGKGGAQLIQTAGTFAAKNATGNAFVRFQIADGATSGDAATFGQMTNAVAAVNSNVTTVANELDATQAGAGLDTDGSYIALVGSNFLENATSLADGAELLDAALFAEQTARIASISDLANTIANSSSNTALMQAEIDQIESSVGLGTDGTLTLADGFYLANAVDLVGAVEILDGVLGQTNADLANVSAEVDGFASDISDLSNAVAATDANAVALSGRVDLVEANSVAQGGLIDGLRTDVDSNSAITAGHTSELSDHEGRITALEEAGDLANAVAELEQEISDESNARVAADGVLQGNIDNAVAAAAQATSDEANARIAADGVLSDDINDVAGDLSALAANAVLKDGSVVMTGDLQLGGFKIANVATPTLAGDAANMGYVDGKVASLGNAFNYIGTLEGGDVQANAISLEDTIIAADRSAGDYYKVIEAGWFTMVDGDTANAAFFNVNDGLVFNTAGEFDKIDNTDSVVTGTVAEITVGGTVDTGFVVGIDGAYTAARQLEVTNEANARIAADALNANAIADETARALAAESALANSIGDGSAAVAAEANARIAADAVLQGNIDNAVAAAAQATSDEANARIAADGIHTSDIANNAADIVELDGRVTALEEAGDLANAIADLEAEIANTNANVAVVAGDLANAIVAYEAADDQLGSDIDNAVAAAAQATSDEANARIAADGILTSDLANAQTEINAIETGAGLETDGSYAANATSHYMANATSLKTADEALDTALFDLAETLATLSQDTIKTEDNLNSVHVSEGAITMSLNVGGNATVVANVVAGANTNTNLVLDFNTANEVKLAAMGDEADVDLRLAAQGAGHVIIGETGVGVIQADDGYDMTVAGGTGSNLNLLGTIVKVGDASGTSITEFSGVPGATAYSTVTNGNTAVTFGAAGAASNLDLIFAPKGTGVVNMSSARVINVANATTATDAVNKGQLDAAVSTATVGVVKTVVATLPATSGTVTLGEVTGTVLRVRVLVNTAYDAGSTLVVGSSGTPNELAADTDIDESTAGIYVVETAKDYSAISVTATVTNATGSNGSAKVIVEYLAG